MAGSPRVVRVGVVGCGVIAYWTHLRILRRLKNATLVAAADPDPQARENARRLTRAPILESSDELFARDDVDAVVISAPTHLHAELAVAACRAGKHVYLEKPIAATADDAKRAVDAAKRANVVNAVGFNRRFHPLLEQSRAMISAGTLGRVRAVQTAFCEPMVSTSMSDWRRHRAMGGGVLLDLASHHIDLVQWMLADTVEKVDARISSDQTEHDTATLSLSMRGGAFVQGFFSYRSARADYLEFIGERATLRVDRHQPMFSLRASRRMGYGTRAQIVAPSVSLFASRLRRMVRPSSEPSYRRALTAFVDAIRGAPARLPDFQEAARVLDVILAAEVSTGVPAPVGAKG